LIEIVCGYGKNWEKLGEYIRFALETANEAKVRAVILSGGDTTDEISGPWEEVETEAEIMELIARESIFLTGKMMNFFLEEEAYNTLTNMLYSKQMIDDENEKIIIICNNVHLPKVFFAAIKVFGPHSVMGQQISFCSFPLTVGKIENLKILIKTVPEAVGYFFRPLGRRIEYLQWKQRTGRNEQKSYKEFYAEFKRTGELI